MVNAAVVVNPNMVNNRPVAIAITSHGSDRLFRHLRRHGRHDTVHHHRIGSEAARRSHLLLFTAGVTEPAYFNMGFELGWVFIDIGFC